MTHKQSNCVKCMMTVAGGDTRYDHFWQTNRKLRPAPEFIVRMFQRMLREVPRTLPKRCSDSLRKRFRSAISTEFLWNETGPICRSAHVAWVGTEIRSDRIRSLR